jgi:hypothetical protein
MTEAQQVWLAQMVYVMELEGIPKHQIYNVINKYKILWTRNKNLLPTKDEKEVTT